MIVYVLFFVYDITGCICYGHYGLHFGGESYSVVYIPTHICVFCCPFDVYSCGICIFPSFYVLYAYFFVNIATSFTFYQLCEIYPQLDENFWAVYAYVFHHMQLYVHFEICLHNINYHV